MRLDHLLSRETYTEPRAWMSLRSTLWPVSRRSICASCTYNLTLFGFERSVKTLKWFYTIYNLIDFDGYLGA